MRLGRRREVRYLCIQARGAGVAGSGDDLDAAAADGLVVHVLRRTIGVRRVTGIPAVVEGDRRALANELTDEGVDSLQGFVLPSGRQEDAERTGVHGAPRRR